MVTRQFTALYKQSGKWVSAWIEEIPGVNTQGRTKKEAKANLAEALTLTLQTSRKLARKNNGKATRETMDILVPA